MKKRDKKSRLGLPLKWQARWGTLGVLAIFLCCGVALAQTSPDNSELLQNKSQMAGYGAEAYRIVSRPDEIISVLRNGTVVIAKRVASPVAAVRGYVYTGGVYEGKWLGGGLSHLLEHLVAGGSSQRRTEAENKQLLQKIGNDSNAYTTYDHTAFFVNTTTPHFEEAVDLVTGWMLGALITPPEYRREYQVVQRELERNKGNPDMVMWDLMMRNRYIVSPARVPVIGYQEVIQGLTRDDVYSYYQLAYQPNNMCFAVAANVDPEAMLKTVRGFVADAKPGRAFSRDIAAEPPVQAPRTVVATFPNLGQARVNLAFPSVKETDADMYPLDLLAQALGGGESSILVEQVRDKLQLCSAIGCGDDTPAYVDGSFQIDMQLDADKIAAAQQAVRASIEQIRRDGIDQDRLDRARAQMKMARLQSLQTSQDVAASLATDYMSTGDAHFSDQYVDRIAAVTAAQVREAANKYLDPGKLITTVLLPAEAVGAAGLPRAVDLLRAATTQPDNAPTTQPAEESSFAVTRTVLDNGLVVIHRRITTTPLVQISMYALGGLTAEDDASNGLGNLAMSLLRRGTTSRSAEQISDFFDLSGGDLTTTCGNNTWYWTVACTRDDFAKTMEVYADLVNHPAFAPAAVAQMKPRIAAGIESRDAAWDNQAFRYFKEQFYGPLHSPYQFDAFGTKQNLSHFGPDEIRKWYEGKILAAPRVLAIFGDVDRETAVAMARQYLGDAKVPAAPAQSFSNLVIEQAPGVPTVNVQRVEIQPTQQQVAGVVIGFESQSQIGEPAEAGLTVAQCLAGGYSYPTGYIFEILRGLVYEAGAFNQPGRSANLPGAFITYAGCDPKRVKDVVDVILESIARLQGSAADIQADWFSRSRDMITTAQALENETAAAQATQAATDELFGVGYDYHAGFGARINAVTLDQVQSLARTRLRNCVVTICTPDPASAQIAPGVRTYTTFSPVDLTPRGIQHDVVGK